jgi:RNA polymerase sigma-70 factor (ECF subfamily)
MRSHLEAGVRQHVHHVVAGQDIDIWEMDVTTPQGSPRHCSPNLS